MVGKAGPFKVVASDGDGDVPSPISAPVRRYECSHYTTCLNLAAALNWDNFTCLGCCGEVNEALCWRAHQAQKKDNVANRICSIPDIELHDASGDDEPEIQYLFGKR